MEMNLESYKSLESPDNCEIGLNFTCNSDDLVGGIGLEVYDSI